MRVLVAPQEFKGTLSAVEAAQAIANGLTRTVPDVEIDLLPMADGGPGTTDALLLALGGEKRTAVVHDPLMRPIEAQWGMLPNGTAVIECASASGLWRLRQDELAPRIATSLGTGDLINAAFAAGARKLIVGLGGSATNDGGAGMAQALGYRLLDESGRDIEKGGAALASLASIEPPQTQSVAAAIVLGATDVTNPLCGPQGASTVYGPQKGASASYVEVLDGALRHLAEVVQRDLGVELLDVPGAGAAGGLGAGLLAFLGAELRSGAQIVADATGLRDRLAKASLVITGEGRLDGQTSFGKSTQFVAQEAKRVGVPVVCIAGLLGDGYEGVSDLFLAIQALSSRPGLLPSKELAAKQLTEATTRLVSGFLAGGKLALR